MTPGALQVVLAAMLAAAAANGPPSSAVLSVSELPGPLAELVDLTRQVRAAIAERDAAVMGAEETQRRLGAEVRGDVLERAEVAYQAALRDLVQGSYAAAAEGYAAIVTELDQHGALDGAYPHWARGLLQLALCQHRLGQKEQSSQSIERLLRADPDAAPDSAVYPKVFRDHFAAVRTDFLARPRHTLTVTASNPGARVFVELREVGVGSARLRVTGGTYRVSVAVGALTSSPISVSVVDRDEARSINTAPLEALRPGAGPGLAVDSAGRADALRLAGGRLAVDRLYLVSLAGAGLERALVVEVHDARVGKGVDGARLRTVNGAWPAGGVGEMAAMLLGGNSSASSGSGVVERWDPSRAVAVASTTAGSAVAQGDAPRAKVLSPEARALLAGPRPGAELQRGKEVLVIDHVPGAGGKVLFKHADHIKNRLHPEGRPLRCKDCHHDLPADAPSEVSEVERCVACHQPTGPRVKQADGAKKVTRPMVYVTPEGVIEWRSALLHAYCRDCHRKSKDGGRMLDACRVCHEQGVTAEMIHGPARPAEK